MLGRQRQLEPEGSTANQVSLISQSQIISERLSQKKRWRVTAEVGL